MKTRTIRQTILLPASPVKVYDALTTARGHSGFTGAAARITPKVGATFTVWGGYIHGKNLELVRGKKIVQSWRPSEETWPEDYYSTVSFTLAPEKGGTRITFVHSGVLPDHAGHLSSGWKKSYWEPLRAYFQQVEKG
ncbi:MAG: SRPBCC domain-containing protein [Thermoplasmata archaeon]|nr:SRPBCC domain-containing protein [Thermoplasmata archaeon]